MLGVHSAGGPSRHLTHTCPSRQKMLVTRMQLSLPSPFLLTAPLGREGRTTVPSWTMGTWSPFTTRYLSPERCDTWPNNYVTFYQEEKVHKPLSWKVSSVDLIGSLTHHTDFSGRKQDGPGCTFPEHLLGAGICTHVTPPHLTTTPGSSCCSSHFRTKPEELALPKPV